MTDRYNVGSFLEHLQFKYIGTGHPDINKHEWAVSQHRDTYTLYLGRQDILSYFAIAENESRGRVKFNYLKKYLQPCGPPSDKPAADT